MSNTEFSAFNEFNAAIEELAPSADPQGSDVPESCVSTDATEGCDRNDVREELNLLSEVPPKQVLSRSVSIATLPHKKSMELTVHEMALGIFLGQLCKVASKPRKKDGRCSCRVPPSRTINDISIP
jgi:hypothetical protein